jgi:O-antigen ligase
VTLIFLLPLGQIWEQLLLWNTASFYGRIDMSQIGWKFFRTSPMWGIGPGNLLLVAGVFTHNSHLGILIEYGIIGATAWAGLLLVTIKCGFIGYTRTLNNNERKLAIAALATLIGLLTGGLAIELQNNKFVWLVFAVLIILGRTSIRLEIAKSDLMERYHIV